MTVWRGRLELALDALEAAARIEDNPTTPAVRRLAPIETTNVQLPTGDRLQIPTGAETLRLKGFLLLTRNSTRDYQEFADLVDTMHPSTAAVVLADLDEYYCEQPSNGGGRWVATDLVRRLADPQPGDAQPCGSETDLDWENVRDRCLAVAVAMLEE